MNPETVNNRMPVTTQISSPVLSLPFPTSSSTYNISLGSEFSADKNSPSHLPFLSSTPHLSPSASALPLFLPGFSGNTKLPFGKLPLHPAGAQQLHGSKNIL